MLKNIFVSSFAVLMLLLIAVVSPAAAQTALTATTLSAAVDSSTRTFPVASTTGLVAGNAALIDFEVVNIASVGTGIITVSSRGGSGTAGRAHVSGAMVLAGPVQAFVAFEPSGTCTNASGLFIYSPIVNTRTGRQYLCSSVTGKVTAGFGNDLVPASPTTAVASAAGKITPSGPLQHITGTAAITGFNIPVGFDPTQGQTICAIPDAIFTTTTANNIALASTAVVNKILCWTYDGVSKFIPSY
jgi:hypothetical protein